MGSNQICCQQVSGTEQCVTENAQPNSLSDFFPHTLETSATNTVKCFPRHFYNGQTLPEQMECGQLKKELPHT